ncbi:MAG TPA: chorismate pyruvate-lyase family protein [Solirubrobacterales bacterium]|nr:chorismate pyruvate-lyase family protein [Solirubrobacterales bacterium]
MIKTDSRAVVDQHFLAQDERPAALAEVEIETLDPFLRGLLFTDGTVTRALAVQTLSAVVVERVDQEWVPVSADAAAHLEVEAGEESVRRRVRIGFDAGAPLLWAESHLLPERLPPGFMGLLDGAPDGIGQSLQRVALESYRELLWLGHDAAPDWAEPGAANAGTIRRLYRIVSGGQVGILISESFAVEERDGVVRLAVGAP